MYWSINLDAKEEEQKQNHNLHDIDLDCFAYMVNNNINNKQVAAGVV